MDEVIREHYRQRREANRSHRAKQRAINTPRVTHEAEAVGAAVEVKNGGAHVVIRKGGARWDYWPGTGRWVRDLDHSQKRSGRRKLVAEVRAYPVGPK